MNCLAPLTTHSPSTSSALVRVAPGVGAGPGLGEAEAGERSPATRSGSHVLLLLVGAVGEDRVDAEADRGLEGDAHRLVDAADLLDRDAEAGEVAVLAGAAVLLGRGEARTGRACPSAARRRPGSGGRGPTARRAARSPPRRTRGRCGGTPRARGTARRSWPHASAGWLAVVNHQRAPCDARPVGQRAPTRPAVVGDARVDARALVSPGRSRRLGRRRSASTQRTSGRGHGRWRLAGPHGGSAGGEAPRRA